MAGTPFVASNFILDGLEVVSSLKERSTIAITDAVLLEMT